MNTGCNWKKIGAILLLFCLLVMTPITVQAAVVTLTFDGNGQTGGTVPLAVPDEEGTSVTLPGAGTGTDTLIKTGYTFKGWNTAADGSGTSYAAGASYPLTADVKLYAEWESIAVTITFDGNGHKSGKVPSVVTGTTGQSVTLPGNTDTLGKDGFAFAGWNTAADGSGTTYQGGASLTLPSSNLILYARWTKAALIEDPDDLLIKPAVSGITDGETVTVEITGFGNRYTSTLYSARLVIKPPVGLNLVKGTVSALTNSTGATYDILCKTNKNTENQTYKSAVNATEECSFDAPTLGTGEYITELTFLFHNLPVGFAIGDKMGLNFKLNASQGDKDTFTIQGSIHYTLAEGDQEVVVEAKNVDVYLAKNNSSNTSSTASRSSSNSGSSISATAIPNTNNAFNYGLFVFIGAAALFLIIMILNKQGKQRVRY